MSLMYGSNKAGGDKPQLDVGDSTSEQAFLKFHSRLPALPAGSARLFERGSYYSAHGRSALTIAQEVYNTSTALKYLGPKTAEWEKGLPSVTLNGNAARSWLREALTVKQMRVEIYAQDPNSRQQSWLLTRQASPGNLSAVEDLLFTSHDLLSSPVTLALKVSSGQDGGVRTVGAAFADVSARSLGLAEFADNDVFSNAESLVIQLGVKEAVIVDDVKGKDYDLAKIEVMLERCGVVTTKIRSSEFNAKNVEQDLGRLLKGKPEQTIPELSLTAALPPLAALINHLCLLSNPQNFGAFAVRTHDLAQYMKLDASALAALNLLPAPNGAGGKYGSLFGLLNRCKTAQGTRLLRVWLKQPLVNLWEIEKRQKLVEVFVEDTETRLALQSTYLKGMPDFSRLSKRLQRRMSTLEEVVRIYQAILKLPDLVDKLALIDLSTVGNEAEYRTLVEDIFLKDLREFDASLKPYLELVESTIDLASLDSHTYTIKPDFDDSLAEIKTALEEARDGLDEEHQRVGNSLGLDTDKKLHLENHQTYGYVLRVTKAEAKLIANKKGYTELSTQKAGTYFTTTSLKEHASNFQDLQKSYEKAQAGLVKEIVEIAASYIPVLENLDSLIAKLDVLVGFADISVNAPIPYVKPKVLEKGGGDCVLKASRHPCLEAQDDMTFIPNDVELVRGSAEFIIITGPNMGGKSTYIRQIGVIALMAQIGCFVPADEATVPIFDCILARVGAGDSQLKGVSTFMAEMLESATILRSATRDSLIIIDELGRGTSTYDGFGLAWAISEYICTKTKALACFATHFHELTGLAAQEKNVKNLQVKALVSSTGTGAQDKQITFLYTVEPGVSGQSYGICVAELAKFPESVIRFAKRKADELEDFGEDAGGEPAENPFSKHPRKETEDGTRLVKEFLGAWAARVPEPMAVDGADGSSGQAQTSAEDELRVLREVAAEFKDRLAANPFTAELLESF